MKVTLSWGTKAGYAIDQGCYPGATWAKSLVYMSNRAKPEGGKDRQVREAPLQVLEGRQVLPRLRAPLLHPEGRRPAEGPQLR